MKTSLIGVTLAVARNRRPLAGRAALPAEHLTVEKVPPNNAQPDSNVLDDAFRTKSDARVLLFDGDTYRRLGQIDGGFNPGFNLSPTARRPSSQPLISPAAAAEPRTDIRRVQRQHDIVGDARIILPPKRAMTVPDLFQLSPYSPDSRFLYVSYVTPAGLFRRSRSSEILRHR